MFNAEYEQEVALCARALWNRGVRALSWSSGPTSLAKPWVEGWADVYIEEFCEPLEANWLATVVPLEDPEREGYGYFRVPYNGELVFEFAEGIAATRKTLRIEGCEPVDVRIDEDESEFYWSMYRHEPYRDLNAKVPTYRFPVWSAEAVAGVVGDWIHRISGCRFDLRLDEELQSPMTKEILQRAEDITSGEAETFDLGDGVRASSEAMDEMLQDPETAAALTRWLKEIYPPK